MKIEKRGESVFISHNGLTVFFNKQKEGYTIKATERLQDGSWRTAGEMSITSEEWARFKNGLQTIGDS